MGSLLNEDDVEIFVGGEMSAAAAITIDDDGSEAGAGWESGAQVEVGETVFNGNSPSAHIWEIQPCRGDMNNDGALNNFDVDPFLLALSDPEGYEDDFPGLEGSRVYHGDCDCSGTFNNFDLDPFVALLSDSCCTIDCSPCESLGFGGGPSAADVAAMLTENTAPERWETLIAVVSELAVQDSPQARFWADVLGYLGE